MGGCRLKAASRTYVICCSCFVTMGKQLLQFGDENTADIILQLLDSEGAEYQENPLYLHSQVLRKCEFYETMLSERWSSDKRRPLQITVTSTHSVDSYIKCIRLLYSSQATTRRFCFSTVGEALAILPVAAQLLFHECVEKCMQYLNAVRWTPAQEAQLRALLSSLQLTTLPTGLAARLRMSVDKSDIKEGLQFLEESLEEMLSTISCMALHFSTDTYDCRTIVADSIVRYFEPSYASSPGSDMCTRVLVKTFSSNVEFIKCSKNSRTIFMFTAYSNLEWLIDLIRRCDKELLETVFKMFSEDIYLRDAVDRREAMGSMGLKPVMDRFLTCLGNGEIITPTSVRMSFLSNWLKTMVRWIKNPKDLDTLEAGLVHVTETLPLFEQRRVFHIWKEALQPEFSSRSSALKWWAKKLHDSIVSETIN